MKKLLAAVALAALGTGAAAQTLPVQPEVTQSMPGFGAGAGAGTIGGIATTTIVAGAVATGVLAAVISNNRSDNNSASTRFLLK